MSKYFSAQKNYDNQRGGNQRGGANEGSGDGSVDVASKKSHLNEFILKLSEFEMKIREMKMERRKVDKLIKKYNVRYTQFYNFQKYIVNYVSLILAQKEYEYWNFMSKGSISFYQSILERLNTILNKFEDPLLFKDNSYKTDENMWFYTKHFFIIKILKQFMGELYSFWDIKDKMFKAKNKYNNPDDETLKPYIAEIEEKNEESLTDAQIKLKAIKKFKININLQNKWSLYYKIDTLADVKSNDPSKPISINKNYFFLFNIFSSILDVFSTRLPPVANYMRINYNDMVRPGNATFVKNTKNSLLNENDKNLEKCLNDDDNKNGRPVDIQKNKSKSKAIENIKFEEVFDPENFAENDALSMYMGLGNMLSRNKSVMLLTYGYSGVGKTFTLFGTKGVEGMLQSTLNNLTGNPTIQMKAFELYGLGVPYKFYWESGNFSHKIYSYTIVDPKLSLEKPAIRVDTFIDTKVNIQSYKQSIDSPTFNKTAKTFNHILDIRLNYQDISREQITNFEGIVTSIDDERRRTGRIKATINNPESSRSIMIYDFKIFLPDGSTPRLVVMDLPGKENLYETYCARPSAKYEPHDIFIKHSKDVFKTDVAGSAEVTPNVQNEDDQKPINLIRPSTPVNQGTASTGSTTPSGHESVASSVSAGEYAFAQSKASSISGSTGMGSRVQAGTFRQPVDLQQLTAKTNYLAKQKGDFQTLKTKLTELKNKDPVRFTAEYVEYLPILDMKATDVEKYNREDWDFSQILKDLFPTKFTGGGDGDKPGYYNINMIKSMMYINPLWLGIVPEIAQHFDLDSVPVNEHLYAEPDSKSGTRFPLKTLNAYTGSEQIILEKHLPNSNPRFLFSEYKYNTAYAATLFRDNNQQLYYQRTGLYGLTSRALATITNFIKDNELENLGNKINNMLSSQEARNQRYGYAGLEGVYINENILGLLEVLGRKIQKVQKPNKPEEDYVSVVCVQPEIYKDEILGSDSGKISVDRQLLDPKYIDIATQKVIPGSPAWVQDNEFYSQLMCLRDIIRGQNLQLSKNVYQPSTTDKLNNFLRTYKDLKLVKTVKGLSDKIHDNKNNWINNYDYNKIFNKTDPPIKSILGPYLADESFKNFYLFFVTSNNMKEDKFNPKNDIDTCSKQIQLMYDTRYFMDVIANEDSKGIEGNCDA